MRNWKWQWVVCRYRSSIFPKIRNSNFTVPECSPRFRGRLCHVISPKNKDRFSSHFYTLKRGLGWPSSRKTTFLSRRYTFSDTTTCKYINWALLQHLGVWKPTCKFIMASQMQEKGLSPTTHDFVGLLFDMGIYYFHVELHFLITNSSWD